MIYLRCQITETQPVEMTVRKWREILRGAHEDQARWWRDIALPRHFEGRARSRYGYQPRSAGWMLYKAKSGHGAADLVYSGQMREDVASTAVLRGFPTRATVTMAGPRYVTPNPRGGRAKMPDLADELLRVTQDEKQDLLDILDRGFTYRLAQWRETQTEALA